MKFPILAFCLFCLLAIHGIAEEGEVEEYSMPDGSTWCEYDVYDETYGEGRAFERLDLNGFNPIHSYFFDRMSIILFGEKKNRREATSSIKEVFKVKNILKKDAKALLQ